MTSPLVFLLVLAVGASGGQKPAKTPLKFQGVDYYHRYSKDTLHEYTPKGQENLQKWADMITINDYPSVRTGDGLASAANSVLETYKNNGAVVVKTDSVARTSTKPAEHLIVVLFPRKEFIEAAFARFLLVQGQGHSAVVSHRIYGRAAGDAMSKWLSAKGEALEKALMAWPMPQKLK